MLFIAGWVCYSTSYMSESFTISTWNAKGAFSDPARALAALDVVAETKADIFTFTDAWHEDSAESSPTTRELLVSDSDFGSLGYTALKGISREDRPDNNYAQHGMLTLVNKRLEGETNEFELGERPAHHVRIHGIGSRAINVIGLYLNDQLESNRVSQVHQLVDYLQPVAEEPTVLMGDFNAMHRRSIPARLLSSPTIGRLFEPITLANSTLPRLTRMANGTTMLGLEAAGFEDIEPYSLATMPSRLPLFQLDHIMIRDPDNRLQPTEQPIRVTRPDLSDHLQLRATITAQ